MIKKIFFVSVLTFSLFMPIFGVSVHLPVNGQYNSDTSDLNIKQQDSTIENQSFEESGNFIYKLADFINTYLWLFFGVICTGTVIFGGYRLITSHGDKKAMKQAIWSLIGCAIGIVIAMLAYTIVTLLANLNP